MAGMAARRQAYEALEPHPHGRPGLSRTNKFLVACIVIASVFAILETEATLLSGNETLFRTAEIAFGAIFSIEYIARLWIAPELPAYAGRRFPRLRYAVSLPAIIDLLAIVPTLASLGMGGGSVLLRFFRVLRILRLAKLGRMSDAWRDVVEALHSRRYELLLTISVAGFVLLVASTMMYFAEGLAQPDKFGSIPRAMWWCIITLTTVGYGDVYPVTVLGQFMAGFVALAGIGLIAMPTGILAAAFSDVVQRRRAAAAAEAALAERTPSSLLPPGGGVSEADGGV